MLARLIDGHPDIASFPFEPRFGQVDDHRFTKISEEFPDRLSGSLKAIAERLGRPDLFPNVIRGDKSSKGTTIGYDIELFDHLYTETVLEDATPREYIETLSKVFFTSHPKYSQVWDRIKYICWHSSLNFFWHDFFLGMPNTQVLFLVRHPMDMIASHLKLQKHQFRPFLEEMEGLAWCESVSRASHTVASHPDRALLLRYEDIVTEPDQFVRQFSSFAEVDDHPILRRPTIMGQDWTGNGSTDRYANVSKRSIGRFSSQIAEGQVDPLWRMIQPWAEALGYRLEPPYFESSFDPLAATNLSPGDITRDLYFTYFRLRRQNRLLGDRGKLQRAIAKAAVMSNKRIERLREKFGL